MFDSYQNFNEFDNVMTEEEKEERRKFESEERLDLKKLLTVISKYKLEDVTSVKVIAYFWPYDSKSLWIERVPFLHKEMLRESWLY